MRFSGFAATVASLLLSGTALAQSGDMVVMRRQIPTVRATGSGEATPTPTPIGGLSPTDPGYYSYKVGAWSQTGTCGSIGSETRPVSCERTDGLLVADALCTGNGSGPRPISTRDALITATCSYAWTKGDWSQPATGCGTSTIVRDVSCIRSDHTVADASLCPQPAPPATASRTEIGSCGYYWSAAGWSPPSPTCGDGTETRTISCMRTDGTPVPAANCADAPPATSQNVHTVCDGSGSVPTNLSWVAGGWGSPIPGCGTTVSNRSVTCQDAAGTIYADALCTGAKPATTQPATDYSTCTDGRTAANPYGWTVGPYADAGTTCGTDVYTRSVLCTDDAGATVADTLCTGPKPDAGYTRTVTQGCTYAWATGDYGPVAPGCGATQAVRPVYCRRSDGTGVTGDLCAGQTEPDASRPDTDYSACTFGWTTGVYGAPSTTCGDATQTRTVACDRTDGQPAPDASCDAKTRPTDTQTSHQISGCGLQWVEGDWTTAPACGPTTRTRDVTCLRSDGQTVDDASCSVVGPKPPVTDDTVTDHSTCSYIWSVGEYPAPTTTCGTTTQTRSVTCRRSDDQTVPDDQCAAQGKKPDTAVTTTQTSSCTYAWSPEAWGASTPACGASTHSRTIDCLRSDGTPVAASFCSGSANSYTTSEATTDYSTCTFKWAVSDWQGTAGCGDSVTQTRSVTCQRSDLTNVADAYCGPASGKPASSQPITDYSQCGYSWKTVSGTWSGGTCSATATRTNTVTCVRQDGQIMTDQSYCDAKTRPSDTDTGNYSGCTYAATYGDYPICVPNSPGGTTGTTTASITTCTRSDGTVVANSNCSAQTMQKSCTVTYTGSYGTCTASSNGSKTGTQSIRSCTMTDNAGLSKTVVNSYCSSTKSCTFTYTPGYGDQYGSCILGSQSATMTSCTATASDGTTSQVSTSYCSNANPPTQACTNTQYATCDMKPNTFAYLPGNSFPTPIAISATSLADARTKAQTICNDTQGILVCMLSTNSGYYVYPITTIGKQGYQLNTGTSYSSYTSGACTANQ